jgi:hypothetical protein
MATILFVLTMAAMVLILALLFNAMHVAIGAFYILSTAIVAVAILGRRAS